MKDNLPRLLTLDEAAAHLHVSRRWLQGFLRDRPHGRLAGRSRVFTDAADKLNQRFSALLQFLTYCGPRLSEALRLTWADVDLSASYAYLRDTKNGEPQAVHLPPQIVASLANLPRDYQPAIGKRRAYKTVFGLVKCGALYELLDKASKSAGVTIPQGVAFHAFRHSYAAWMRREAGLDTSALVATGRWKDPASARVYEHVEASEEARKADLLPTRGKSVERTLARRKV